MVDAPPARPTQVGRPLRRPTALVAILTLSSWLLMSQAAWAACHVAAFVDDDVTVTEGGKATLTIELVGGAPTCEGKVRYRTVDGTAKAPGDYTSKDAEVTFTAGDSRRKTIEVQTIDDKGDEPQEAFTVQLSAGSAPGNITGFGSPATVRITDNDVAPPPSPTPTATRTSASPTPSPTPTRTTVSTTSPTPTESPTSTETPTPPETPSELLAPTPTESETQASAPDGTSGRGGTIAAVAVGVILIGGGVGLWLLRRRYGFR